MRWTLGLLLFTLLLHQSLFAAPATVFGPKTFQAAPSTASYNESFSNSKENADGVLTITNGNGQDLSELECPKKPVATMILCKAENVERHLRTIFERPSQFEISLNGRVIATQAQLPDVKGKYQTAIKVTLANTLKVRVKGLWTSYLSVEIKADSTTVNQNPIARFSATPAQGIAPELISFSGLTSSDPDGDAITQYTWDFGDGGFATGSLVTHNFLAAGTYQVKLTVQDSRGGTGSLTQAIVIRANQVPIANFTAIPETALGVLKAKFDASTSQDSDGSIVSYDFDFGDGSHASTAVAEHIYSAPGTYQITLTVKDNKFATATKTISLLVKDATPPVVAVSSPVNNSTLSNFSVPVAGSSNEPLSEITAQFGSDIPVVLNLSSDRKSFSGTLTATGTGSKIITLSAKDLAGNQTVNGLTITISADLPPIAKLETTAPQSKVAPLMVLFDASKSTSPQGKALSFHFDFGDGSGADSANGVISHSFESAGSFTVTVKVTDSSGLESIASTQIIAVDPEVPPPVENQAPPLASSGLQPMIDSVKFLYEGENAIQRNVQPGAIDANRVAVLQGVVFNQDGSPLSGVKISVLEMPEVGETFTSENGKFHIAVNGGAVLTVHYERNGYFPLQRKISTSALDYFHTEKVVMVPPDSKVTQLQNNAASIQVAKGSKVSDTSGERTPMLVIPPLTEAKLQMPDGSLKPISTISLRATEYTVGADGPQRMPAELPTMTGYTYAVELSVDEAIAAGAEHVVFSNPIPFYVDNFLDVPAGSVVPVGSYDAQLGAWKAENDGIVVKVLSIQNNSAILTFDDNGTPATPQQLSVLKITPDELMKIAENYAPGQSFWRARLSHLSPIDLNFLTKLPRVRVATKRPGPPQNPKETGCTMGSIIGLTDCSLGEELSFPGVPTNFHYSTLTKPGRVAERQVVIPLFNDVFLPSDSTENIHLKIEIAGQVYEQDFTPSSYLSTTWSWDGKDSFGRNVYGRTPARITIDYESPTFYEISTANFTLLVDAKSFGSGSLDLITTSFPSRQLSKVTQTYTIPIGNGFSTNTIDVGGWSLSQVHRYDPISQSLQLGNSSVVDGSNMSPILTRIAGNFTAGSSGDNGPASLAKFNGITALAVGPDDSIYVAEFGRIRKIGPDGNVVTIAGNGVFGPISEGQLALNSSMTRIDGLAITNTGAIIFGADNRIWKFSEGGTLSRIAGTGEYGYSGDGGLAINAKMFDPKDLVLGSDGTLYFIDSKNRRIRKIAPDGMISLLAGNGEFGLQGNGGPATLASFSEPTHLAVGLNKEIYVSDKFAFSVRVITNDGFINRFAGVETAGVSPRDGEVALQAKMGTTGALAVDREGNVYISDISNGRIYQITPNGILLTIAGAINSNENFFIGSVVALNNSYAAVFLKFYGKDRLLAVPQGFPMVHLYHKALPDLNTAGYSIGSLDGSEIYQFSSMGRHLQTLFSKTGKVKWKFAYDNEGRLISMTDAYSKVTTIQRDGNGRPLAMVGPFGQALSFTSNADGYLTSVSLPTGETTRLDYNSGGLLLSYQRPNGNASTFEYNSLGELIKDSDAAGGFKILEKISQSVFQFTINETTATGRKTEFIVDDSGANFTTYRTNHPSGRTDYEIQSLNSEQMQTFSGSSFAKTNRDIDPRLGGITQFFSQKLSSYPWGSDLINVTSSYTPQSSTDFFSFTQVEEVQNGPTMLTTVYRSLDRQISSVTGAGKKSVTAINEFEQPVLVQNGAQAPIQYSYNNRGQLISILQGDRESTLSYNSLGQVTTVTNPEGQTTSLFWDPSSRLTQEKRADNKVINYQYDLNSNLSGIQPPDRLLHRFTSNLIDLFAVYTPPTTPNGGGSTRNFYNLDRQITKIVRPDGTELKFLYNPTTFALTRVEGTLKSIDFEMSTYSNTFPNFANSSDDIQIYNQATDHVLSLRIYQNAVSGIITYRRTRPSLLNEMIINDQVSVAYQYDQDDFLRQAGNLVISREPLTGTIIGTQIGNITESHQLNSFGEISQSSHSVGSTSVFANQYTRDKLGRITKKIETILGQTKTHNYSYDLAGRLITASLNGVIERQYTYDGN
ncbi:MAG: PKD domain-containing protein, partial [Pseudobdellovibrionaceae bacterium]